MDAVVVGRRAELGALLFRTRATRLYTHMHTHTSEANLRAASIAYGGSSAAIVLDCIKITRRATGKWFTLVASSSSLCVVCYLFVFVCRILVRLCRERGMWLVCVFLPLAHRTHANITSRMRYMHTSYLAGRVSRSPRTLIRTRSARARNAQKYSSEQSHLCIMCIHVPRAEGFNCRALAAREIGYKQKPCALANV